jgi:hypothetical protein
LKSVKKVISELKAIPFQSKEVNIFFISSTFTFPQERAMEIARRIEEENLMYRFGAYARAQDISRDLVEKLKSARFFWLFIGAESMDDRVLKLARKTVAPEQIEEAIRLSDNAGLISDCSFIVGLPGENRESAKKIAGFLKKSFGGRYCLFPLVDMDTSDLAKRPERYHFKRKDYMNWSHPHMSSQEVPMVMAEIIMEANESNQSYSTFIIDALIGNHISSDPLTSVLHPHAKRFYLLMETGTILYLKRFFKKNQIDGKQLRSIANQLKQSYLPDTGFFFRIKTFVMVSVKIMILRILRFYFLKRRVM